MISLKVREHVIRDCHRTWHTYEELLSAALHEQATQVNVILTTASSQAALQAGMTAAQLIREQEGVFAPKPRPMTRLPQTSQHQLKSFYNESQQTQSQHPYDKSQLATSTTLHDQNNHGI